MISGKSKPGLKHPDTSHPQLRKKKEIIQTFGYLLACCLHFYTTQGPTYRIVSLAVGWVFPHYLPTKKMSHRHAAGPPDPDNSSLRF